MRAGNEWLSGKNLVIPVAAGEVIIEGHMVAVNADGYAVAAKKMEGLTMAGCAQHYADNRGGENGEIMVPVRRGSFVWNNDGTIKDTDLLKVCYAVDGQTVTISAEAASKAGLILSVEDDSSVIVEIKGDVR